MMPLFHFFSLYTLLYHSYFVLFIFKPPFSNLENSQKFLLLLHPIMSSSSVNHISQPCIYGHFVSSTTERKSRLMKWLSKIFKGGSSNRGQQPQFLGDENMVWRAPARSMLCCSDSSKRSMAACRILQKQCIFGESDTGAALKVKRPRNLADDNSRTNKEKEELDRAIALSLAEDLKKPKGYRWRTDQDEDLARSLHDNSNSSSYPPKYDPSYAPWEYNPNGCRKCSGCHKDIISGNYLGCMGTFFHPECFLCHACGFPITEYEFSLSGNNAYHKLCFKEMTHPKCEVCHQFIPTNGSGLIEYRCHPFWSQKYCPAHENDGTKRCCSCERLESRNARYMSLGDGRSLCLECMESAIMDTGDCQPLYHSIRDYYEGMNMKIDQEVPMLLVERHALNEAIEGEKHGLHHMPETRGLCLSEEQTVTSILRRPRIGGRGLIGLRTHPQKLIRRCDVTAILVIYGLPRLLTGAILAHELMHAWLRLKGYRNLTPEVEEGICQVLSHMWLEAEVMPGSRNMPSTSTASSSSTWSSSKKGGKSQAESKIGEFFIHQIAHDASPAYGGGFRAAYAAVNKYGLRSTLDHIRLTGSFPL